MAVITSHLLNATDGTHASGVKAEILSRADAVHYNTLFSGSTDDGGRLRVEIETQILKINQCCELVFHTGCYFLKNKSFGKNISVVPEIVIRLVLTNIDETYHCPLIISPNGYSIWWSS